MKMLWHPASLMLRTWATGLLILLIMPIQLVTRSFSLYGSLILALFIGSFCIGTLLRSRVISETVFIAKGPLDFRIADRILIAAALAAILVYAIEVFTSGAGDLSAAWEVRSERATLLLQGLDSGSSIWFQIGFLLYPVGYVAIAREVVFRESVQVLRVGLFGFGPLVACAIAIGGRGPILFALIVLGLSILARRQGKRADKEKPKLDTDRRSKNLIYGVLITITVLIAMNYFVNVFIVRSEAGGGLDLTLENVVRVWGVDFAGPGASFIRSTLGEGNAYLLFAFSWYLAQGPLLGNEVFTHFQGDPGYGVYGVELATSLVRRLNGEFVASRLYALEDINIFGFVYSAFGTLYIDFYFFGILVAALWGYLASVVYVHIRLDTDGRWLLVGPFVTMGIMFSLINTPIGLSNGLITYAWLLIAFLAIRQIKGKPAISGHSGVGTRRLV
jgi:hypothetical protein